MFTFYHYRTRSYHSLYTSLSLLLFPSLTLSISVSFFLSLYIPLPLCLSFPIHPPSLSFFLFSFFTLKLSWSHNFTLAQSTNVYPCVAKQPYIVQPTNFYSFAFYSCLPGDRSQSQFCLPKNYIIIAWRPFFLAQKLFWNCCFFFVFFCIFLLDFGLSRLTSLQFIQYHVAGFYKRTNPQSPPSHLQQCQVRVFHNFCSKLWSKWMVLEKWSP